MRNKAVKLGMMWGTLSSLVFAVYCVVHVFAASDKREAFSTQDPIVVENADQMDYNQKTGDFMASGNVLIRQGNETLSADKVWGNLKQGDVQATGDVVLSRQRGIWRGKDLKYNFRTKTGNILDLTADVAPFRVTADRTEKVSDNEYAVYNAKITTCTNAYPGWHYHVRAKKATVVPDEYVEARSGVLRFGVLPVMYMPYWHRNLTGDFGLRIYPGYSSDMGPFLLNSYRYRLNSVLKAETHVDYRAKRGVALGQDLRWKDGANWDGEVSTYYLDDKEPVGSGENVATSNVVDNERYRILLKHRYNATEKDYVLLKANYLSDTDVLEDFFEDEYRRSNQPENYAVYTHTEDALTAGVLFNTRLNDFYTSVNRMPEVDFDFMRQRIGTSDMYYEGKTAFAALKKVWPENAAVEQEEYSVFRVDSKHMVYQPLKYMDFLNVIPRAGWRGTYYSETVADSNDVDKGGADVRSVAELGSEVSYKAFKVTRGGDDPRRHVVEPYANYTLVPEPTLGADEIYQFDEVDSLEEQHKVDIGVRNKLQKKKNSRPFDLVDVDVSTAVLMKRNDGEKALDKLRADAELRPYDELAFDFDGIFDMNESSLDQFNSHAVVTQRKLWAFDLEHRFMKNSSSLFTGDLTYFPNIDWTLNGYGRYEAEEGRLEEQGGYIQRNLDCMVVRTGLSVMPGYTRDDGSEKADEWRVIMEMWLTAFPSSHLLDRHRK